MNSLNLLNLNLFHKLNEVLDLLINFMINKKIIIRTYQGKLDLASIFHIGADLELKGFGKL